MPAVLDHTLCLAIALMVIMSLKCNNYVPQQQHAAGPIYLFVNIEQTTKPAAYRYNFVGEHQVVL